MSLTRPRIMLYSHDTYGLGHLRRTLSIATQLSKDIPNSSQLLITGSVFPGAFGLPEHLDMIKLPALSKRRDGRYKARTLPMSLSQVIHWRAQMILQAALVFQPDLLLVDKSPAGVQDELLPTLRYLKTWHPETRLVLGMRDIEDSPEATSREWETKGIRKLHEEVYDHILLYGEREIFDPVIEYEMSRAVERKMTSVGYLGRANPTKSRETIRQELHIGDSPLILLTAGGGGDGFELFQTYLESFLRDDPERSEAHTVIVTGPLMAKRKRELLRNAAQSDRLTFLEFTQDLASYMAAADLIVSMAGYNTVREALSLGTRLLLVPRTHPRVEQLIRAERLAGRGFLRFLDPADLSPRRLADEIKISLSMSPPSVDMDFDGLERASQVISQLLTDRLPSEWEMGFAQQLFAQKALQELDL